MRYEKRYLIGIDHKDGPDDFVTEYVADNCTRIQVEYLGNSVLGYRVDGESFKTLKQAKQYCEALEYREIRDIISYTSGSGKNAIIIGRKLGGYHVEIRTRDVGTYIRDYRSWHNVIRTLNRFGSWKRAHECPWLLNVGNTYAAWRKNIL